MQAESPDDKIESIVFKINDGKVGIGCYTFDDESSTGWLRDFNEDNPDQKKFKAFLEKMPMKMATITFIPEEETPDYRCTSW